MCFFYYYEYCELQLDGETCSEIPSGDVELGSQYTSPGIRGGDGNMATIRHTEVTVTNV